MWTPKEYTGSSLKLFLQLTMKTINGYCFVHKIMSKKRWQRGNTDPIMTFLVEKIMSKQCRSNDDIKFTLEQVHLGNVGLMMVFVVWKTVSERCRSNSIICSWWSLSGQFWFNDENCNIYYKSNNNIFRGIYMYVPSPLILRILTRV